jgi:hypothetical protein
MEPPPLGRFDSSWASSVFWATNLGAEMKAICKRQQPTVTNRTFRWFIGMRSERVGCERYHACKLTIVYPNESLSLQCPYEPHDQTNSMVPSSPYPNIVCLLTIHPEFIGKLNLNSVPLNTGARHFDSSHHAKFPISRAGSTGRCNTLQAIDWTMLPAREPLCRVCIH